ncbi:MAG: hypothetical protein QXX99_00375 [Candidatus Bathyarchaeia archaeon]
MCISVHTAGIAPYILLKDTLFYAGCGLVIDQASRSDDERPKRDRLRKRDERLRNEQHIMLNRMDIKAPIDFLGISDSVEGEYGAIASIIDVAGKLGLSSDVIEAALDIYGEYY